MIFFAFPGENIEKYQEKESSNKKNATNYYFAIFFKT
jgi:hypothetical protein